MKTYKKYKDSGIEWIGEIPEHWEVKRLKYCAEANPSSIDKKSKDDEDEVWLCNYVDVYKNDFISNDIDFMKATASKDQIRKFTLEKGDVILTKDSESANDIGVPAFVTESFENVVCGYHLTHVKPKKIKGEYLFRQFQCRFQQSYFEVSANGVTRFGLGTDKFNSAIILIPPSDEQTTISTYLDRKTAEIDRIIANKQKLVALYEEEKQAIINQAVAKGLDPNVKLKDSGLEWLGKIPEHWIIKKLKHITEVKDGTHDTPDYITESENSIPFITSKDITSSSIDFTDCKHIAYEDYLIINNRSNVTQNDIIMPMIGTVGGAVIVETNRAFSIKNVALFKTSEINCNVKYIKFFIDSDIIKKQFEIESRGGVQNFVSLSLLRNLFAIEIPKKEQDAIVTYLENESNIFNILIEKFNKQIDLLQEYRTTLISEVVTGKVKVYG